MTTQFELTAWNLPIIHVCRLSHTLFRSYDTSENIAGRLNIKSTAASAFILGFTIVSVGTLLNSFELRDSFLTASAHTRSDISWRMCSPGESVRAGQQIASAGSANRSLHVVACFIFFNKLVFETTTLFRGWDLLTTVYFFKGSQVSSTWYTTVPQSVS